MREGHLGMTLLLLTNGADVNIVSPCSATPLHVATIYRRTDIAKVLKEHGSGCQGGRRCACMPQGVPIPWNHAVKSTNFRAVGLCPNESDVLKMSNRFSQLVHWILLLKSTTTAYPPFQISCSVTIFCSLDLKENTAVKWYVFIQDISNTSSRDIRMAKNKAQSVSYDFLVEIRNVKEFMYFI